MSSSTHTIISVAIATPFRKHFDYLLGEADVPLLGTRVSVPFGHQKARMGIVVGFKTEANPSHKLRVIHSVLDEEPVLSAELLALCQWCADYYHYPLGDVCQLALPTRLRKPEPAPKNRQYLWCLTAAGAELDLASLKRAPKQQQLMGVFKTKQLISSEQCKSQGFDANTLRNLYKKGWLEKQEVDALPAIPQNESILKEAPLVLNHEQEAAITAIESEKFTVTLLEGVTGSGKTEVYLQAIARVLAQGRQALVLVPEIGLTPQTLSRFEQRFNVPVVALHSGLSDTQRFDAWYRAKKGLAPIVVGTRSSIFIPLDRLGLIVVDEEHDLSYKQQEGVRYSARDLAIVRAQQLNIPLLLGSATPALETLHNALSQRYQHLPLKTRANAQALPSIRCVESSSAELAPESVQAISTTLEKGLQVLIFINRRGYAPALICQDCGWLSECPSCDSRMTLHQQKGVRSMQCHHCGHQVPMPRRCPSCHSSRLQAMGTGTQRSEQALEALFPNVPVIRIDRDSVSRKGQLQEALDIIGQQQPCILIGTQMLAKGHHFASLGLAIILDLDSAFFSSDFRGAERMGQLLTQVAGRVGREQHKGEVIIQTQFADHPSLRQLLDHGYHDYAKQLLAQRQLAAMPPFEYLAVVRSHAQSAQLAQQFLLQVRSVGERLLDQYRHPQFLGPFPMVMEKRNNRYHHFLQVKSTNRQALRLFLKALCIEVEQLKIPKGLHWLVDVDPQEF